MARGKMAWRIALLLLLPVLLAAPDGSATQPILLHEILQNGLRVVVASQPGSPAVTVDAWIRVGSRDESEEENGVAHFVEHMLFKGTRRRSVGEIAREVEALGGWINAATGYDYTHYYVVVPAHALAQALEMLADALANATFEAAEVERERTVILQELSLIHDTPARYVVFRLFGTAFTVHPYRRPVGGSVEVIRQISRDQLMRFYRTHYGPGNTTVVVAGGVDGRAALNQVRRAFWGWRRVVVPRTPAPQEPPLEGVRRSVEVRDVHVTTFAVGWLGPSVRDDDHYAVDVLVYALGRGRAARWVRELRDRRRVVQTLSIGFPTARDPSLVFVVATTADADESRAERALLEEVRALRDRGLTEEELERAKTLLEAEVRTEQHTSQGLAASLGFAATVADLDYHRTYLQKVRAVKGDQVLQVAHRYLDPQRYAVVSLRPRRSP